MLFLVLINFGSSVNKLYAQENLGIDELLSDPSRRAQAIDDAREMRKIIESMPPEEVQALMEDAIKIYEGLSDTEKAAINNLSQEMIAAEGVPMPEPALPPTEPIAPYRPTTDSSPKKNTSGIRNVLERIINLNVSINQKISALHRVSADSAQEQRWVKIHAQLESVSAILERIINPVAKNKQLLLEILITDEFSSLVAQLKKLRSILQTHEPQIQTTDTMGFKYQSAQEKDKTTIDKETKARSIKAVNDLINQLRDLGLDDIIKELEKMMKKYEPKKKSADSKKETAEPVDSYSYDEQYGEYDTPYGDSFYDDEDIYAQQVTPQKTTSKNKADVNIESITNLLGEINKSATTNNLEVLSQDELAKNEQAKFALDQIAINAKMAKKEVQKLRNTMKHEEALASYKEKIAGDFKKYNLDSLGQALTSSNKAGKLLIELHEEIKNL